MFEGAKHKDSFGVDNTWLYPLNCWVLAIFCSHEAHLNGYAVWFLLLESGHVALDIKCQISSIFKLANQ